MSYQALLFCPDDKIARVVTQVLSELEFQVDSCNEPFAAVKKLTAQHFDAVVVDCDNEQNATLLFKSARNSSLNQAALAVAVVEGQSGVAKAFRIGANLVLTKPINVEQSKGTLRVARGLLRKSDAGKVSGANVSNAQPQVAAPMPSLMPAGLSKATPVVAVPPPAFKHAAAPPSMVASAAPSTAVFEVEHEAGPKPDPTEVALFESMPDPSASLKSHEADAEVVSVSSKQYPWQPVRKPQDEVGSQHHQAPMAKAGSAETPSVTSKTGFSGFAAAAPAPAKEKPEANTRSTEKSSTAIADRPAQPERVSAPQSAGEAAVSPGTVKQGSGGTKVIAVVAAVVIVGAVAFFGWKTFQAKSGNSAQPTESQSNPLAVTSPVPASTVPEQSPSETPSLTQTAPTMDSSARSSEPAEHPTGPAPASTHASPTSPNVVVAQSKPAPSKAPETIVVKSGVSIPSNATEQLAQITAPSALAVASPNDGALSSIVSAPGPTLPKPAPQTVKLSQGLVQGLLVHKVQPVYPPQALQSHREGSVQLQANISKDGNVTAVKVVRGDTLLARAAADAVKQWKYKPYLLDGQPIPIETQITVNFRLP